MAEPVHVAVGLAMYTCAFVGKMQMCRKNPSGFSVLALVFCSTVAVMISCGGFYCSPQE